MLTGVDTFSQGTVPEAEISNGIIQAKLYLPDIDKGYYRATRFDWSGIIPELQYRGHSYYGKWFEKYEPTIHDVIMGPVEEFGPVGYDLAKANETFLKIGVGMLQRPDDKPYNNFRLYDISNPGKWKIRKKSAQVQFIHILKDIAYSYKYVKKVKLVSGSSELHLEHRITNTGDRTIETTVYNHNFMMIDQEPTGPNYEITFPFELSGRGLGIGEIAVFDGRRIKFLREMTGSERIYCGSVTGFSEKVDDYNITIENLKADAGVKISCDHPLTKLVFWCSPVTVCPEPYIKIKIEPGQSLSWTIIYEYFTR